MIFKLGNFQNGWIVGDFNPTLISSKDIEVGIKYFQSGDSEPMHFQKSALELTVVVSGSCRLGGQNLESRDIMVIEAGVIADFVATSDCVIVCIKSPSLPNDKVIVNGS